MRIGIVWAASEWDDSRFSPLSALRPLLALQHVRVFGLQQGRPARDALSAGLDVVPLWQHTSSIVTAAAALLEMDFLITIDGMATHLGASQAQSRLALDALAQ